MILRSRILTTVWLALFAITLLLYIKWNGPLRAAALNLIPLLVSLTFVFSWCGIGWPLSRYLTRQHEAWFQIAAALALGLGLTSLLVVVLGVSGSFHSWIFGTWYLLGLLLFFYVLARFRPYRFETVRWNVWNCVGAGILFLFLIAHIPFVLTPEVSTDAISYHLLIPKIFLQQGKLTYLPFFVESNYPSLAAYNYLPLLKLTNEIVCKSFHFWIALAVLVCFARITRKTAPGFSLLLAPALFLSMPVTAIHMGWAWNDFIYTLFAVLSIYFLLNYHLAPVHARTRLDLFSSGLMAGLASWTKYTFVLFFLAVFLLLLWAIRKWKWNYKHCLWFFIGIALVSPFWLIQNAVFTGNPFYPFLNGIFQSPFWTEASNEYFMKAVRRYEIPDWNWTTYFTFPIHMTLKPRLVDIQTGILPLLFVPLLMIKAPGKGVSFLKLFLACGIIVWIFIQTENRSLFLFLGLLFCVGSIALQQIDWSSARKGFVVALILLATSANFFMTLVTTYLLFDPVRYFFGRETKAHYISRMSESQQAFDFLNSQPDVGRVLLVSSHVPYYLERAFYFSSLVDPPVAQVLSERMKSPVEIRDHLRSLGITHIMINVPAYEKQNNRGLYSWTAGQRSNFQQFVLQHCKQLFRFDGDRVFKIN